MTKHEELIWRLGKLPTVEEITTLIDKKVITQEEAREILFNKKVEETRDIRSLETEIKFLREIIEKLSQRERIVEVIKQIQPIYNTHPFYQPYQIWCGGIGTVTTSDLVLRGDCTTSGSNMMNCSSMQNEQFSSINSW